MKNLICNKTITKLVVLTLILLSTNTLSLAGNIYKSDTLEEIQKQYEHLRKKFQNIKIDKFEDALRIVIDADFIFEPNSKTLKFNDENSINSLIEHFKKYSSNKFIVTIHSDTEGDDEINLEISKRRASELKNYLQKNGIKSNRFKCIGLGESQALNFKKNDIIKTNNRIEILILAD